MTEHPNGAAQQPKSVKQFWQELMESEPYTYLKHLRATGRAEGTAQAILSILDKRGVHIPDATRKYIVNCLDGITLDAWLDRSLTATTDNLLAPVPFPADAGATSEFWLHLEGTPAI